MFHNHQPPTYLNIILNSKVLRAQIVNESLLDHENYILFSISNLSWSLYFVGNTYSYRLKAYNWRILWRRNGGIFSLSQIDQSFQRILRGQCLYFTVQCTVWIFLILYFRSFGLQYWFCNHTFKCAGKGWRSTSVW